MDGEGRFIYFTDRLIPTANRVYVIKSKCCEMLALGESW